MPMMLNEQAPVPPPAYHRAQARLGRALHLDALTLVRTLHLLTLCRLAVRLAHRRCPPAFPAGPGGAPRPTVRRPCYSSRSCARCGGFPTRICTTVTRLTRSGLGLWIAAGKEWLSPHSLFLPAVETRAAGRSAVARSALRVERPGGHPSSPAQ